MTITRAAFTLIELLVVIAILAVLIGLVMLVAPGVIMRGKITASLNNMRQVGNGFQLYANDNEFCLPSRVVTSDRWPVLISYYLEDPMVLADPSDQESFRFTKRDPLSNQTNNTSYIMNGFNDAGARNDEVMRVKLTSIDKPSDTILLANQTGTGNFYVDLDDGDQNDGIVNRRAFKDGSNYLFVDGSVRFIKAEDLKDEMWLVHKTDTARP